MLLLLLLWEAIPLRRRAVAQPSLKVHYLIKPKQYVKLMTSAERVEEDAKIRSPHIYTFADDLIFRHTETIILLKKTF